jgi:hypothetical protein
MKTKISALLLATEILLSVSDNAKNVIKRYNPPDLKSDVTPAEHYVQK